MERGFAKSSRKHAHPVLDVTGPVGMDRTMSTDVHSTRPPFRFAEEAHKHLRYVDDYERKDAVSHKTRSKDHRKPLT
jgi:hypothetical protein